MVMHKNHHFSIVAYLFFFFSECHSSERDCDLVENIKFNTRTRLFTRANMEFQFDLKTKYLKP